MSTFLSSLTRRLVPLRRRRSITSSGFVASRRPLFFPCGGACHRDVVRGSPFVVVKRGRTTTLRKVVKLPRMVVEQRKKRGRGGGDDDHLLDGDGDGDGDEPCVWRRTILLGRRCQPLEFTDDIHYDCEGQRLWQPRTPPLPMSPVHLHPSGLGYMDRA
jgi:hypothetical protein